MGTYYYPFKKPVTSATMVKVHETRIDINIWINHALAGHILCRPEEVDDIFEMLIDDNPVAFTWFGGMNVGMEVKFHQDGFDGYITDGRRAITVQELQELVKASQKAHAELRESAVKSDVEGEQHNG